MLAAIPYRTFPWIGVGPLRIHTFGLMVALGILAGIVIIGRRARRTGVDPNDVTNLAIWMVIAGMVGARITWVMTHFSELESPLDVVALWKGGLQFSGGFIAAVAVAMPWLRRWSRDVRWRLLDGFALALTVGLGIGRIGCYSVGEHLGNTTNFFLAVRYDGGVTREGPLAIGWTLHNTSLYEFIHLAVLAGVLAWVLYRSSPSLPPGAALGIFALWYGVARFLTDFLRAYDEQILGLTGAQWMCMVLVPAGAWIVTTAWIQSRQRGSESAEMALAGVESGVGETTDPEA